MDSTICAGCLSVNRTLTKAKNDIKTLLHAIIGDTDHSQILQLCWECMAIINKFLKFNHQVKQAQKDLAIYRVHHNSLTSLSHLTIVNRNVTNITSKETKVESNTTDIHSTVFVKTEAIPHKETDNIDSVYESYNEADSDFDIKYNDFNDANQDILDKDLKNDSEHKVHHNSLTSLSHLTIVNRNITNITSKETKVEPNTTDIHSTVFVKTEAIPHIETDNIDSVYESYNEADDYFDIKYNDFNDANQDILDKDLKNDSEHKNFLQLIPEVAQNSKVKKKSKTRTKENFNESDDEPLKSKNEDNVEATSKRKVKEVMKKDHRKSETPAGVVTNARVAKTLKQLNVSSDQLEMVLLSWEEVEAERQAAKALKSYTRHQSRCQDCVLGFNHPVKLEEHMRKHEPIKDGHQCSVCRVWCKDTLSLTAHRRRHRFRWRCRKCGRTWTRAEFAADHMARAHGASPRTQICELCGHAALTIGKLRSHMKSHAERQKCELCGKTFRDKKSLRTHLLFIHKGEKCDKRFSSKNSMEVHLETHNASIQLYCQQCDVSFKNRVSYNKHMKYTLRHIDPAKLKYACDTCDKKFAREIRLHEHKMAVHLKLTPIACTVPSCHFTCSSRPVLRTHIRMKHRGGRDKRNHVCHLCGKAYKSKNNLEGHLRAHAGERPLRCPRCFASFSYDTALSNHLKHCSVKHKT